MTQHPLFAQVYDKRGKLVGSGTNHYSKTHPIQAHFAKMVGLPEKIYLHAEIAALLDCRDKIPHSIHVSRYTKNGRPALAAPCPACMAAIKAWGGVKSVTFTIGGQPRPT